jgi:DNA-binding transcriptional regulator YhcF (GntR family)
MKNEKSTFPKVKLTNFRPLTGAVFLHPELTLLQKLIMADILSVQLNGEQYFKGSSKLADELSMSKRTIQTNFQQLQKKNIIRTKVVHTAGMMSRRYAEVIDLNRWVTSEEEEEFKNW